LSGAARVVALLSLDAPGSGHQTLDPVGLAPHDGGAAPAVRLHDVYMALDVWLSNRDLGDLGTVPASAFSESAGELVSGKANPV
jgi:hypothetical protein